MFIEWTEFLKKYFQIQYEIFNDFIRFSYFHKRWCKCKFNCSEQLIKITIRTWARKETAGLWTQSDTIGALRMYWKNSWIIRSDSEAFERSLLIFIFQMKASEAVTRRWFWIQWFETQYLWAINEYFVTSYICLCKLWFKEKLNEDLLNGFSLSCIDSIMEHSCNLTLALGW